MPINSARLLATFLEILQINATSRHEGAIAAHVAAELQALGAEVVFDSAGEHLGGETGNLLARLPGTVAQPPLLFCAHLDTVESTEHLCIVRQDGIIASDGTTILGADDRAGVAVILEMARAVQESDLPRPPLELLFTIAEEVGVMGSKVMDPGLITARSGFIADTSGDVGLIVTRSPAQKGLRVTIHGKAAHAGMAPETGISAIEVAARAIASMRLGRIDEETTANIGVIHGGKATNIVADTVVIDGEARSRDPRKLEAQVAHMRESFKGEATRVGAVAEVEVTDVYPAFNLAPESPTVRMAAKALETLGISPTVTSTGGGSDANFLNAFGIPAAILSAGYHHPHTHREFIAEEQLVWLAEWLFQIVRVAGSEAE